MTAPEKRIPLASIDTRGGTQVRESMAAATVDEYAAAIADGAAFPPVVVFFDGKTHWLADGFHRVAAHEKAGVPDVLAEVREGTREDALWFALSANKRHGLPMSPEDKRRAVRLLLSVEKWAGMSNAAIAKELGISDHTVADVKKEMGVSTSQNARLTPPKTEGADGKSRPSPGASSDKVRDFFGGDPERAKMTDKAIAEALDVARGTVAKVRKQMASALAEDTPPSSTDASTTPAEEKPAPPARHAVLVEIDAAKNLRALDAAFNRVALAGLSEAESAEASAAYQRRSRELQAQGATTPAAPAPVSPQAATAQPVSAETVTVSKSEWEALQAEIVGRRQWQDGFAARAGSDDAAAIQRIMRLVALASSPNEHEAASAALKACRMMRERGLIVSTSSPGHVADTELDEMRRANAQAWEEIQRDIRDMAKSRGVQL